MAGVEERQICLGKILGAHGVRGRVRIESYCADPPAIASYGPLTTESGDRQFRIVTLRHAGCGLVALLSGVSDRNEAARLAGVRLYVDRSLLPDPAKDEFYVADLEGLEVYDPVGRRLGTVTAVHDHGAGDILEIEHHGTANSAKSELLPFNRDNVLEIDLQTGRIVVDPFDEMF